MIKIELMTPWLDGIVNLDNPDAYEFNRTFDQLLKFRYHTTWARKNATAVDYKLTNEYNADSGKESGRMTIFAYFKDPKIATEYKLRFA